MTVKKVFAQTHERYERLDVEEGVLAHRSTETVLRYRGKRYGLVLTEAGFVTNRGPGLPRKLLEEPEAAAYGLAVCLDNHGGTGRESRELTAAGLEHEVEDGDLVAFDTGAVFEVEPERTNPRWGPGLAYVTRVL